MKPVLPFYTTIEIQSRFFIRYVLPPHWTVQEFPDEPHSFADPGEAIREFKINPQFKDAERVAEATLGHRILQHERDQQKLKIISESVVSYWTTASDKEQQTARELARRQG